MASPAGTYVLEASNATGKIAVTINFDDTLPNLPLVNRGSPARCLIVDNATGINWPYYVKSPQGVLEGLAPTGRSDATVVQIRNSSGVTDLSTIQMGLGAYAG